MIALSRLRQHPTCRWFDFHSPVAWLVAGARIIVTDIRGGIDVAAAVNSGRHMHSSGKAPVSFDHSVGNVDAVNDDGYAGAAGNDQDRSAAVGQGQGRHS